MSENNTNVMSLNSLTNKGTAQNRKRVGRGMALETVRRLVEVIKAKSQDLEEESD